MASIYIPRDERVAPQIVIGVENNICRTLKTVGTSALVLTEIFRQDLPLQAFDQVGRVLRYSIHTAYIGANAVDTKRLQVLFAGQAIFDHGLLSLNNLAGWLQIELAYTLSAMDSPLINWRARQTLGVNGAFTSTPTFHYQNGGASFDPNAPQSLIINAVLSNAANSVNVSKVEGTLL